MIRSLVRFALQHHGCHDVAQSPNGPEALELCAGREFDVLIVDFQMKPMTGLDFLRELAKTGHGQDWPVIMLSAETNPETIQEARNLGVCEWVGKPISVQTLIERVGLVLSQRGKIRQSREDPGVRAMAERHHARLMAALATAEESVRHLNLHPREAPGLAHGLRQVFEDVTEHARVLGYGLVMMLAGRASDLATAMAAHAAAATKYHAAVMAALSTLVTAMKRVAHNRMEGDGAEAGLKLLAKIDGLVVPVRASLH